MKRIRIASIVACILAVSAVSVFAGGGGGLVMGTQYFDPNYANLNLGTISMGGFGYGSTLSGQRIGGFGMALMGFDLMGEPTPPIGGVGGLIIGQEIHAGPFMLALNLWLGLGGMAVPAQMGAMVAFGEANLEAGIALTRWMQLVGFVGFQSFGNLIPGRPFDRFQYYTPVMGARIVWGSF